MTPEQHTFLDAAIAYCNRVGGSVTSWIRSPARNTRVGGKKNSAHLQGLGLDVVPETMPNTDERLALARELNIRLIIESDHDHLQPADWPPG